MILGMESTDNAGNRFRKRTVEESFALVSEQTSGFHHFGRDNDISGIAADILVGVAGGGKRTFVVDRRLDGKAVARFELILPLGADFDDLAAEFVTDDDGVVRHIIGNTLVGSALLCRLETGHADTVADDPGEDLVFGDLRQIESFEPEIFLTVESYSSSFHCIRFPVWRDGFFRRG